MMNDEQSIHVEFAYGCRRWVAVIAPILVVSGGVLLGILAFSLDQPVTVLGIRLTAEQGRVLFGGLACVSVVSAVLIFAATCDAFAGKRRIAFTSTSLIIPRPDRLGLSRQEIEIPYHEIVSFGVHEPLKKLQVLRIEYKDGVAGIPCNMVSGDEVFVNICKLLEKAAVASAESRLR